jgi:hypothetical protein
MRNILAFLALILIVGAVLGYYLGWYRLASESDTNTSKVILSVDKDKIEADKDAVEEQVRDLGQRARQTVTPTDPPTPD